MEGRSAALWISRYGGLQMHQSAGQHMTGGATVNKYIRKPAEKPPTVLHFTSEGAVQMAHDPVRGKAVQEPRHGGQRVQKNRGGVSRHVALQRRRGGFFRLKRIPPREVSVGRQNPATATWKSARTRCDWLSRSASTTTSESLWTMTSKGPWCTRGRVMSI